MANCTKEKIEHNTRSIQRTDERWEVARTDEADLGKKPLINSKEWIAIEGKLRDFPTGELEGGGNSPKETMG